MYAITTRRRAHQLLFVGLATGIYAAAFAIVRQLSALGSGAHSVAIGLTIDLGVIVPLAFYFLVVRPLRWSVVTVAPVFVLSVIAASAILPADRHHALRALEMVAIPVELGLISWIGWRAARAVRRSRRDTDGDVLERIRGAALAAAHNERAAAIITTEIAVFYYALASWRSRPHVPAGARTITHHQRSAHAAMVFAFILAMAVEGIAVHIMLQNWSPLVAWIFTAGNAYGALWLIADYRLTVLRPILVFDDRLVVRAGLRCSLTVPLARISATGRMKPEVGKERVNLTFLSTPTHWLEFTEPVVSEGPYGFRRPVRAIGFEPDAPEELDRLVTCR